MTPYEEQLLEANYDGELAEAECLELITLRTETQIGSCSERPSQQPSCVGETTTYRHHEHPL